jgi:hypothetical protein
MQHILPAVMRWATATVLCVAASGAQAQRETEMFVPIGQSPGLSGKHTLLGAITAIDGAQRVLSVKDAAGAEVKVQTVAITRQWLDRSALMQPNRKANANDYRVGMTVEVKLRNNDRALGMAEWVKLKATP